MYSWVYRHISYGIHLCTLFWQSERTGTDSQAVSLVCVMSHFKVIVNTLGYEFDQQRFMELTISNTTLAIKTAHSYQYFAENNPPLF